jgi:hypothetical protein
MGSLEAVMILDIEAMSHLRELHLVWDNQAFDFWAKRPIMIDE